MNPTLATMIEKMQSDDRDYRYMAASDLIQELEKPDFRIDAHTESRLANQLLKLLEDKSADVQGLSVRCLGALLAQATDSTTQRIMDELVKNIIQAKKGSEAQRDISVMALKTAVPSLPFNDTSGGVVRKLFPQLLNSMSSGTSPESQLECVEVVQALSARFGTYVMHEHTSLIKSLLPFLSASRSVLRKRAISCIATVANSLSDELFGELVQHSLTNIKKDNPKDTRTSMHLIVALSTSCGHRYEPYLENLVKNVFEQMEVEEEVDDVVCEMLESCLLVLQSFVQRCPKQMSRHIDQVIETGLKFVKYDPNYAGDSEEEDDMDESEDDDDDDDDSDDDDDDQSEDYEDASWKARRASCKLLSAVIFTRPDLLAENTEKLAAPLISRFSEREESVKLDVFSTFTHLARQANTAAAGPAPIDTLNGFVEKICKSINKQLKEKSGKVRVGAIKVGSELCVVLKGEAVWQLHSLTQPVGKQLGDKTATSALKLEALTFLRRFLINVGGADAAALQQDVVGFSDPVFSAVNDRYFKVSAAGLDVCIQLIKVMKIVPLDAGPLLEPLYVVVLDKFAAQEQDSEVKERAMMCMGTLIGRYGDKLGQERLNGAFPLLSERLNNELIRLSAVTSFLQILSSDLKFEFGEVFTTLPSQLSSFLRQSNRSIKQTSLSALIALVEHYGENVSTEQFSEMIKELSVLVSDSDVALAGLALRLSVTIIKAQQGDQVGVAIQGVREQVIPQIVTLVKSPMLQDIALDNLLSLLRILTEQNNPALASDALLNTFTDTYSGDSDLPRVCLENISQCIAEIALSAGEAKCNETVTLLVSNTGAQDIGSVVSLLSLGKIGCKRDITSHQDIVKTVLGLFQSSNEDVKTAASYALGSIVVGNMEEQVPILLKEIGQATDTQYLLLHSLKEVISQQVVSSSGGAVVASMTSVVPLLFKNADAAEEGVRNVVAECLGKLALLNPSEIVNQMKSKLSAEAETTRSTIVTALKFTLSSGNTAADESILPALPEFLALVEDPSVQVRRAALISFHAAVHHKASSVPSLQSLFGGLLKATVKDESLIRKVQLGPFKHIIDDGLPVRKAAYECLDVLFDKAWHLFDINDLVKHLVVGLGDDYDIKMLVHQLLGKIAAQQATSQSLISVLDQTVQPLNKTVTTKTKESAVQQEIERNQDLIRSAMRLIHTMNGLAGADSSSQFGALVDALGKNPKVEPLWREVCAERRSVEMERKASGLAAMDMAS